ncbi:hypothetical protein AB1Y20_008178 [Prymnesium parvum]|uniref:WW domain-containing protein n=1 Tax=Prymnesium parvum TaxID=97485 RepID=A0AB34IU03_PRYPA
MICRLLTACCPSAPVEDHSTQMETVSPAKSSLDSSRAETSACTPHSSRAVGSARAAGSKEPRADEPPEAEVMYLPYGKGRHPNKFQRVRPDGPWWVSRATENGKLFWMHKETGEMTWLQPLPRHAPLPPDVRVGASMREWTQVVTDSRFFGAPADKTNPSARTGICGRAPDAAPLRVTAEQLALEHSLYPPAFLKTIGLKFYLMCEDLNYNGQRRRDVPDLGTGILYIDVGDRSVRRKRHSFHHELWHMVDYHLLGSAFEGPDFEWARFNPRGFQYGRGGKHMRTDTMSSQLSSSPSPEFLNRYSTSSITEDRAEVWAALMCYQQILTSQATLSKAALLKARVAELCPEMDESWWARVREEQLKHDDFWEPQYLEEEGWRQSWINWLTGETRETKPMIESVPSAKVAATPNPRADECEA